MTETSQVVGNYEFFGIVDKPKAGVTYKVRNLATGELEALRTLSGAAYSDPESLERFLREIKIHTRLSHPNVVAFHDALELDGRLVMTSELVEGSTLTELLQRGAMPQKQAIQAMCQILSGLEEAHALGIVHRGITAEHVTIARDGQAKLGGFGLAKPTTDVNLTRAGAIVGNARYMSPEQVTGVDALDARADLYSVGILLFYTLTGKLPFDGANDFDIMVTQVSTQPPLPSSVNPAIAPETERVILTALAKKRDQRFASATAFRSALEALNGGAAPLPVPAAATLVPTPPPAEVPVFQNQTESKPNRTLFVLGFVGVAVLLIVIYFATMHRA